MKKDFTKLFIGLIIVAIGLSLLFGQLGLDRLFGFSFGYLLSLLWPLIIIVLGVSVWLSGKNSAGLIISTIGLFFLLSTVLNINVWSLFWPVIIIAIGLMILFKGSVRSTADRSSGNFLAVNTIFSGSEKKVTSENFEGGNIFVLFGGSDIDLRKSKLAKEGANVDLTVVFGGCKILVPDGVQIISEGSALFGGWENKVTSSGGKDASVLRISGSAVFGGVEIQ